MEKKVLHTLEYDKIIETLTELASSQAARERCKNLLPMTDIDQINLAQKQTDDALLRIFAKGSLSFSGIHPIGELLKRLEIGGTLSIGELLKISSLLETARRVKTYNKDEISDDASSNLKSIRRSIGGMNERIRSQMTKVMNQAGNSGYLQDAVITMRDNRYCLPVKAEAKNQVPGMIHDQSSSGSTLFIEPA